MKKLYLAGILSILLALTSFAQSIPQGMNYQAVARDKSGNVLQNTAINLKISLFGNQSQTSYYAESHTVTTNEFGLFSLVIGNGKADSGVFAQIPWGSDEIWMNVAIQTPGQTEFAQLGSSKLYAVPYALYAGKVADASPVKDGVANNAPLSTQCPCNGGITSITVLYLGPSGVTIGVYNNQSLQPSGMIAAFAGVNNGAVLTINVPPTIGTLQNTTYFEFSGIPGAPPLLSVPTTCSNSYNALNPASPGGTWGNISVVSQTDKNGETCTACNTNGLWYIGGNAVLDACNTLGTVSNNDLVLISNNTPRLVVSKGGDVTVNNNLNVSQGLNVSGNVSLNQNSGSATNIKGPVTLSGTLGVNGATTLNNTLTVQGISNLFGNLNVNQRQSTTLTGTLTVERGTQLDSSLVVGGNSDLHGFLHVDNQAPAVFTGTTEGFLNANFHDQVLLDNASFDASSPTTGNLVVAGGTGIGQTLYVGGASYLLGSLSVGGNTDLYGYLHVNRQQPTLLTGTLADSLDATFFQHVFLPNATINSFTFSDGELVVAGGVGIGENLNVGGSSTFRGPVSFGSVVTFTDTVNSTDYTNGTIVVDGGAGIAKNLNVNGAVNVSNSSPTSLSGTLTVTGISTLNNTVNANAQVNIDASNYIHNTGSKSSAASYPLTVKGGAQGIRIQLNGNSGGTADMSNDYLEFLDNSGNSRGGITGEIASDVAQDVGYEALQTLYAAQLAISTYNVYKATKDNASADAQVTVADNDLVIETENQSCADIASGEAVTTEIGDDAATTPCVGLGVCETAPPPSDIAAGVANVVEAAVADGIAGDEEALAATNVGIIATIKAFATSTLGLAIQDEVTKTAQLAAFEYQKFAGLPGVYFKSGSGDYAEWLPKTDPSEKIYRGDIVGVKGGHISKNTEGAEKLMVISSIPIVLGNEPEKGKEANYEKVAFIGQIPVKVLGKAEAGDYILCQEGATGFGIAKHAADMTPQDYQKVVGTAWESGYSKGINYVNTAVGLTNNDFAKMAIKQQADIKAQGDEITALKKQVSDINAMLAKIASGNIPAANASVINAPVTASTTAAGSAPTVAVTQPEESTAPVAAADKSNAIPDKKKYFELTRAEFESGVAIAIAHLHKTLKNPESNPILQKLENDPAYKDQMFASLLQRSRSEIAKRIALDKQSTR